MIRFGANRRASEPNQRESGNEKKKKIGRSSTRKQRRPSRVTSSGHIERGSEGHFAASVHPRRQLTPLRARQWRVLFFVCKFAPNWAVLAETSQIEGETETEIRERREMILGFIFYWIDILF